MRVDLTGRKIGRLLVVGLSDRIRPTDKQRFWHCRCDCGNSCEIESHSLSRQGRGRASSCGCLQRERTANASLKHGLRRKGAYNPAYYQYLRQRPEFRLRKNVSCVVWQALKQDKKSRSVLAHLPFTIPELKAHLEAQFEPWMSWDNYGTWHVDHIVPKSKFPYTNLADPLFKECWALSNLRPLRGIDNLKKGTNMPAEISRS